MKNNSRRGGPSSDEGLIEGRNAILEALRAGRGIDKLYVAEGEGEGILRSIISKARSAGAVISVCDRRKLDAMSQTGAHQGVIAAAALYRYADVQDMLSAAKNRGEAPLLVLCDGLTDPHNLGAVIRSAEVAGAHGVIIPKHRSAGLTSVTAKASAGAVEHMPVAREHNLTAVIQKLKEQGLWIFGTAADGRRSLFEADLTGPSVLVIGSEGEGMSRLVHDNCDHILSIPVRGKIGSLNASAAAAVLLYETVRQRMSLK